MIPFIQVMDRLASGKNVLIFLGTQLVCQLLLLFGTGKRIEQKAGEPILDLRFQYTHEQVMFFFTQLGEAGRALHLYNQLLDFVFLFFYSIGYALLIMYLVKKLNKETSWISSACLLPYLLAFFDVLENTGIIWMLRAYPDLSINLVYVVNLFPSSSI